MVLRDTIQGIIKCAAHLLARCMGVERVSKKVSEHTRGVLKVFSKSVSKDAVTSTKHARRKAANATDVLYALNTNWCFTSPPFDGDDVSLRSNTSNFGANDHCSLGEL